MNKELKFWLWVAVGIFALLVVVEIVQTLQSAASAVTSAESNVQAVLAAPGAVLANIWNWITGFFGGGQTFPAAQSGSPGDIGGYIDNTVDNYT